MARTYVDSQFQARYQQMLPLSSGSVAYMYMTPLPGTAAETKTRTSTGMVFGFGRAIVLKRLAYCVKTAQSGVGDNLTINLYNGTTSVATLAITTQTAGQTIYSTADINSTVTASGYIQWTALSVSTTIAELPAAGMVSVTYEELYS